MADDTEVILPIDAQTVNYTIRTVIDDITYTFDVRWNDVEQAWFFDLLDDQRDPIVSGIKIVIGAALGGRCQDLRMPAGVIWAVDLSAQSTGGQPVDATLSDLGTRVVVYYYPPSSFA